MKIALYIEDGLEQIVLTPQTETEKAILGKIHNGFRQLQIARNGFYRTRGGWIRQSDGTESTIIVLNAKSAEPEVSP